MALTGKGHQSGCEAENESRDSIALSQDATGVVVKELRFRVWNGEKMSQPFEIFDIEQDDLGRSLYKGFKFYYSDKVTQSTGLVDKDGREIFEGDVFGKGQLVCVVTRQKNGAWVLDFKNKMITPWGITDSRVAMNRVKGNIYENPELMNDANNSLKEGHQA